MLPASSPSINRALMLSAEYVLQRVGGLGAAVAALAPRLADRIPLDLVVPRYDDRGERLDTFGAFGRVHRVDATRPDAGDDFDVQVWRMNDEINAYITGMIVAGTEFDVLHVHDWLSGYTGNDLHVRYGIPLVVTMHATEHGRMSGHVYDNELSTRIHLAERHLAQEADLVIACSEFMRREIIDTLAAPPEKVVMIPNGVEIEKYWDLRAQRSSLTEARARWTPEGGPLIFNVGRQVWEKGPDLLVAAMPDVLREFPSARAVLAGKGPMLDRLAHQIESMGLGEHVHLAGFIDDDTRNQLYALADVAVFPSRYEPFGIVALEAMAAAVPVVVGAVGGLAEVVEDGVTGLCVEAFRADSVAAGIIATLQHREAAAERVERARAVVKREYSWDRIADLTLEAYRTVMGA